MTFDELKAEGKYSDRELHDAFWSKVVEMCKNSDADIMRFLLMDESSAGEFYESFTHLISVALCDRLDSISFVQQLNIHAICMGDMNWLQMIRYIRSLAA